MDRQWNQVRDFHKAFGVPQEDRPCIVSEDRKAKRVAWMREEVDEFVEAHTLEDQADAMIDLIYFALGTLVEMGTRPEALFDIVHNANMSKLGPDGKPIYGPDSKVKKPSDWQDPAPLLRAELERQKTTKSL